MKCFDLRDKRHVCEEANLFGGKFEVGLATPRQRSRELVVDARHHVDVGTFREGHARDDGQLARARAEAGGGP